MRIGRRKAGTSQTRRRRHDTANEWCRHLRVRRKKRTRDKNEKIRGKTVNVLQNKYGSAQGKEKRATAPEEGNKEGKRVRETTDQGHGNKSPGPVSPTDDDPVCRENEEATGLQRVLRGQLAVDDE